MAIMQTEVDHYLSREHNKVHLLHWISTSSLEWFNVKLLSIFWQALGWLIELAPVTLVVLVSIITLLRGLHRGQDVAFLKTGNPPETQTENYKIGKVMGKGAFGKVNLAIHRLSNKFVALKSINK